MGNVISSLLLRVVCPEEYHREPKSFYAANVHTSQDGITSTCNFLKTFHGVLLFYIVNTAAWENLTLLVDFQQKNTNNLSTLICLIYMYIYQVSRSLLNGATNILIHFMKVIIDMKNIKIQYCLSHFQIFYSILNSLLSKNKG